MVKPQNFIPIHGEWRQLVHHAELARATVDSNCVFLVEDGDFVRIDGDGAQMAGGIEPGREFLDGSGLGLVDDCTVRDRRRLAGNGVLVPMVAIGPGRQPCRVRHPLTRGFIDNDESEALLAEAHDIMLTAIRDVSSEDAENEAAVEELVESTLKRFFRKKGVRRPVIVPVVVEHEEP